MTNNRDSWTWPLVVLLGILVVVCIAIVLVIVGTIPSYTKQCEDAGGKIIGGECYLPGYIQNH